MVEKCHRNKWVNVISIEIWIECECEQKKHRKKGTPTHTIVLVRYVNWLKQKWASGTNRFAIKV